MLSSPQIFVGTMIPAGDASFKAEDIHRAVLNNLKAGVRYIDTAEVYGEALPFVGLAIKDSKVARKDLFVASKIKGLPCEEYAVVKARMQQHIKSLNADYLDLLLVHWPGSSEADLSKDPDVLTEELSWDRYDATVDEAWANMVRLKEEGLTKRIGISNFYSHHLQRLLKAPAIGKEPPVVNQIYLDATEHQFDFVSAMQKANIQVMAYRPVQFLSVLKTASEMGDTVYGALQALKDEVASEVPVESLEQLVLMWLLARGIHVCVQSSNHKHIKDNLQAKERSVRFPAGAIEKFPLPSELSTMLLAYDSFATKLQTIGIE